MKVILIIVILFNCNLTFGQTFSFNRNYISEDTYCIKLKPRDPINSLKIESELERFGEKSIDKELSRQVFRIVSMGVPGDEKSIVINSLEKKDSTCILTIKTIKNLKRNEITVHTKTFDELLWDKFNLLADTTFWNQTEEAPNIRPVLDGQILIYEFNDLGKYHRVVRGSSARDTVVGQTKMYLNYLLNYFFDVKCKTASR
jgi:hypothetical protein